jgi:hypothetical protein
MNHQKQIDNYRKVSQLSIEIHPELNESILFPILTINGYRRVSIKDIVETIIKCDSKLTMKELDNGAIEIFIKE